MMAYQQTPIGFDPRFPKPLDKRLSISSVANLATELPRALRNFQMVVLVEDETKLYHFENGLEDANFLPYNEEVISFNTVTEYNAYKYKRDNQIVYITSENKWYWNGPGGIQDFKEYVVAIDTNSKSAFKTIIQPFEYQIVYVKDVKQYFYVDSRLAQFNNISVAPLSPLTVVEITIPPEDYIASNPTYVGEILVYGGIPHILLTVDNTKVSRPIIPQTWQSTAFKSGAFPDGYICNHKLNSQILIVRVFEQANPENSYEVHYEIVDNDTIKIYTEVVLMSNPDLVVAITALYPFSQS